MKRFVAVVALLSLVFCLSACGKQAGLEGKVVDGNGKPVAGVKIMAMMEQPIKGYEQFDTVTGSDGGFSFKKLYPGSRYVLKPWSDKWTTEASASVETGPDGETVLMPNPLVIEMAYSVSGGSLVIDLATGKTRFTVSTDGVITDSQTNLEWAVGPDQNTDYDSAVAWVAGLTTAGGGWRMPGVDELQTLYQKGVGKRNLDPSFKTTGWWVWGEPRDSSSAWCFFFNNGERDWYDRDDSNGNRVIAVRPLPRR